MGTPSKWRSLTTEYSSNPLKGFYHVSLLGHDKKPFKMANKLKAVLNMKNLLDLSGMLLTAGQIKLLKILKDGSSTQVIFPNIAEFKEYCKVEENTVGHEVFGISFPSEDMIVVATNQK